MADKHWIQSAVNRMKQKGTVGSFSGAAKRAGMSTEAYAHKEVSSSSASPAMKKKAQFALNVHK